MLNIKIKYRTSNKKIKNYHICLKKPSYPSQTLKPNFPKTFPITTNPKILTVPKLKAYQWLHSLLVSPPLTTSLMSSSPTSSPSSPTSAAATRPPLSAGNGWSSNVPRAPPSRSVATSVTSSCYPLASDPLLTLTSPLSHLGVIHSSPPPPLLTLS